MTDWFPVVFIVFKVLVLGTGMFFAIKWHHEQWKKQNESGKPPTAQRVGRKAAAIFVLALLGLLLLTLSLGRMLGLDLTLP